MMEFHDGLCRFTDTLCRNAAVELALDVMSQSSSQASAFYREVAQTGVVWTLRDHGGFPAPIGGGGRRAHPFWSSRSRVATIIQTVPAFAGFEPQQIPWEEFRDKWIPGMTRDRLLAGVNWTGAGATGFDLEPADLQKNIEAVSRPF
jgi:hypothetical protein